MTNAALSMTPETKNLPLKDMANAIRALSMDAVQKANSGHPGMPMGMADVATVLFSEFLKFDASAPRWADRDRFVLSAGHGSMLLYSLLYLTGYEDMTLDEIKNFRQLGARTNGHPEFGEAAGIETTTGPLGQGIANAVGMALAEKMQAARYGSDVVDHYTYVIAGDGCLMEGISHEAASMAGHLKLNKLIMLFDDNRICIDGPTDLTVSDDQCARFMAYGWDVQAIDGHDSEAIHAAIAKAKGTDTPSFIACRTTIAYGAPTKAGTSASHGAPLGDEEIQGAREALGWVYTPFEMPEDLLATWRNIGQKGSGVRQSWEQYLMTLEPGVRVEFERTNRGELPETLGKAVAELKQEFAATEKSIATRASSGMSLEKITEAVPELIGGSADLTGSNNTKTKAFTPVSATDFSGRYIYYGVREHAMCAAMNGMALHGGFVPYGGTFFVFTDYCRPSIRLAALMEQRAIYVMTHDSIGLGEDGPTHQPVEHLASLRAMPNLQLFRPADATEVAECWELSLQKQDGPSMLVLTRQGLPPLRTEYVEENLCAKGAYVISPAGNKAEAVILATGSEVSLAVEAQKQLRAEGIDTKVVSVPSFDRFDAMPEVYQQEVLEGDDVPKVAVEAAVKFGWEKYLGRKGVFIGMDSYGASAPANELYEHFGITAEKVVGAVRGLTQ